MDALLQDCTIEEQHVRVKFLWTERVKSAKIHLSKLVQYGRENSMAQQKVYEWIERFTVRRTSNQWSLIWLDLNILHTSPHWQGTSPDQRRPWITLSTIAEHLDISYVFKHAVVHDNLGNHEVCSRWIPKKLSNFHKQKCVEVAYCHQQQDIGP